MEEQKKRGDDLDKHATTLVISNLLMEIIEQYTPFQWMQTIESFPHPYKVDKNSYDYSGEVKPMTKEEFQEIISSLGKAEWYSSKLEELLSSVYINQWTATYISNHGKHWVNFMDLLQDKFNEWKYEHFQLYDEDGNEINESWKRNLIKVYMSLLKIRHMKYMPRKF